tara:strand:- start:3801 stop:5198 length:1398 start_codon:yes stop_codon:yes gene_type:complete
MKITDKLLSELVSEQIGLLTEDLPYSIKKQGDDEFVTYKDLESFANYIQDLENDVQYTINTPQTDGDVTGSGATIRSKFSMSSKKKKPEAMPTGYLGDIPIEHYRDDMVKLPEIYLQVFKQAGFDSGDLEQRLTRVQEMFGSFGLAKKKGKPILSLDKQFSQILVLEFFEKIAEHIKGGGQHKLKEGGLLFESFLALLLSGTLPVDSDSYEDIIDNKLNNISVKFMAIKSTFYQAWSTVDNYFKRNKSPMIHVSAIKEKVKKEGTHIVFYISDFTYDDYLEINEAIENRGDALFAKTDKAIWIDGGGVTYTITNTEIGNEEGTPRGATANVTTRAKPEKDKLNEYQTGKQPRITFLDYGNRVAGKLILPSRDNMRKKTKILMDKYDDSIDLLFKEITNFRKLSNMFFSAEQDQAGAVAEQVMASHDMIKQQVNQGFRAREVQKQINEKITPELLDKLIKAVILES